MSEKYASTQPAGFKNQITNVAIVGATGQSGKHMVEQLVKGGKHSITALTRPDTNTDSIPSGVKITKVDYSDPNSLTSALRGIDALIITLGVAAPPETQNRLFDAAHAAKVPWILPNEWGTDGSDSLSNKENFIGARNKGYRDYLTNIPDGPSYVGVCCSFWYEYSLSFGPESYGFDFANKTVTYIDEGDRKINTSTWPQVGRAVASLLSLPILPKDENDKSATLDKYRDNFIYISSFHVSQQDMLASILRVTGDKQSDWTTKHEPHRPRYESGVKIMMEGNRMGFVRQLYTRALFPDEPANFIKDGRELDNAVLGLPEEDLDEWTGVAVKMHEEGVAAAQRQGVKESGK